MELISWRFEKLEGTWNNQEASNGGRPAGDSGQPPPVHARAGGCLDNGARGLVVLWLALPQFILTAPKVGTTTLALSGGTQNTDCLEGWGQAYSHQPVRGSA